ncbi:MAG: cyclic pyranopterin monophosphate synthase MoaC [Candidatus Margulisiibacteriota bacterium]|nr:MAG: molybdenum cofactor biosynthesis protein C [Candidatus Margulisbacteria bacterium GWD2_39_127]OGI03601.1 MAG: molybdenum cofactor biosynthesis protein C [Candidatus Margulisbacteria bacterium GWF2_38_17]OGI11105.1 MAG: molybdenum cofactor biosynthesis protein C [Candidatus Margulisbacteria bacterium GWE2_39_32]PZM78147.1 MAG: cyclic pyranopterin monophosphate synthase MoaC [Candidatus Margulisiibacteriota bacterium]HAR62295.1 cyclic pyranopterin monophosphate synthase MoaC [Candidatus M
MGEFTHLDDQGKVAMVDVSKKPKQSRIAVASGSIRLAKETILKIMENEIAKGSVLVTAQIAGIQAAKKTSDLIPLCHPIFLSNISVKFEINEESIVSIAQAKAVDVTGVEMEALTAVSVSLLTIYDMCKAVDKAMVIGDITLLKKEKTNV